MLPKKLLLFLIVVLLGTLFSILHFSFLRDFTRGFTSKTIVHFVETSVNVEHAFRAGFKRGETQEHKARGSDTTADVKSDPLVADEKNLNTSDTAITETRAKEELRTDILTGKVPEAARPVTKDLPQCPINGADLVGLVYVDQTIPTETDLESQLSIKHGGTVEVGGWWKPPDCQAKAKVAIIIPFRNRYKQLTLFLRHLHPILQRQLLDYRIFVIEQDGTTPFNRAALFNVGYKEALKVGSFDCFVFSDVDLLPEDDRNNYGCPASPRHMSVAVDKFNYRLPYESIFGGVGSFTKADFEKINGFSNLFWGWGGEDDDLYNRITARGMQLTRPPLKIGRYTMVKFHHFQSDQGNPERNSLLHGTANRMTRDGLNSLVYTVVKATEQPLVTIVTIDIKRSDHL